MSETWNRMRAKHGALWSDYIVKCTALGAFRKLVARDLASGSERTLMDAANKAQIRIAKHRLKMDAYAERNAHRAKLTKF